MKNGCPFCDYAGPSEILMSSDTAIVIEPLSPCVPGHRLVIPKEHMEFLWEDCDIAVALMSDITAFMVELGYNGRCNVIINDGAIATQTVKHVHVHLIPREEGDGVKLPWTYQDKKSSQTPVRMWTCGQSPSVGVETSGCGFEYPRPPRPKRRRGRRVNECRTTTCSKCGHIDALYKRSTHTGRG